MNQYFFSPNARQQQVIINIIDHIIQGDLYIACLSDRPEHVFLEYELLIEIRSRFILIVYPR